MRTAARDAAMVGMGAEHRTVVHPHLSRDPL
jgi:hypothetical protein